jgi:hypothetical protein
MYVQGFIKGFYYQRTAFLADKFAPAYICLVAAFFFFATVRKGVEKTINTTILCRLMPDALAC